MSAKKKHYGCIDMMEVDGTCTRTMVIAAGARHYMDKTLSKSPNFATGMFDVAQTTMRQMGTLSEELLSHTILLADNSMMPANFMLARHGDRIERIPRVDLEDRQLCDAAHFRPLDRGLPRNVSNLRRQPFAPQNRSRANTFMECDNAL